MIKILYSKLKSSILLTAFFFVFTFSSAQLLITGKVLNQSNKKPIAYANIGIVKTGVGTISNEDGSFTLQMPSPYVNDTLLFSAIGFGKRNVLIHLYIKGDVTIYLKEQAIQLNEVTITSSKEKNKFFELGNRRVGGGVLETDTTYAGSSMALLIENKNPVRKDFSFPVYLQKVRVRIFRNNLSSFKLRVRLYSVDSLTHTPDIDLLNQSLVVESSMKNGWLEFDLSPLKYLISKPFFVAIERILTDSDRAKILKGYQEFIRKYPSRLKTDTIIVDGKKHVRRRLGWSGIDLPGTFIGVSNSQSVQKNLSSYSRNTSFAPWEKMRGGLSATVTVSTQPFSPVISVMAKEKTCDEKTPECKAEQLCKDFLNETNVNGLQLCVSVKGKIKLSQGFGIADVENNVPVTTATKFRINSISKSITSGALIKLMSENKLDIDAPIQKYVPSFPAKKYPFTTRQLAGHLAGIRDYSEKDLSDLVRNEHYLNSAQATKVFENDSLLFKPGSTFHYSTFGWSLIGAEIEGVIGMNYLDYMEQNIWKPMNMLNTCGDDKTKIIPNRSKFYDATGEENDYGDFSYKYPGGGLLSSAEDLVTYGNELLHGNLLDPTLKKTLFETQYTLDQKPTGYGIGWYTGKDKNGHRIWYHAGDMFSSSSYLILYPDDDIVIAFLANSQDGVLLDVQKIGEMFYSK